MNMSGKCLSADLKEDGIIVCTLHPGWVQTPIGGGGALIQPKESVEGEVLFCDAYIFCGLEKKSAVEDCIISESQYSLNLLSGMMKVILGMKAEDSGKFFRYSGNELPW